MDVIVKFNVGGCIYSVLRSTLQRYKNSLLYVISADGYTTMETILTRDENGFAFIDADPKLLIMFFHG